LEREQRADFVKLGSTLHVDVHAVALDLPAKVCISRAVSRKGHEGNLQGGKAALVVNRMLQKKETPLLTEGFSRIMSCNDDGDIKKAVDMYNAWAFRLSSVRNFWSEEQRTRTSWYNEVSKEG